jgi:hypothetical protein
MLSTDGSADVSHQDICAFFNNSGEGLGDRVHGGFSSLHPLLRFADDARSAS